MTSLARPLSVDGIPLVGLAESRSVPLRPDQEASEPADWDAWDPVGRAKTQLLGQSWDTGGTDRGHLVTYVRHRGHIHITWTTSIVLAKTATSKSQDLGHVHGTGQLRQLVQLLGSLACPQVQVRHRAKGFVSRVDIGMTIRLVSMNLCPGASTCLRNAATSSFNAVGAD